ncbi:MAG: UDP-N-acetylmuramoyl-L-alanyl-D-glutamate--2,6-diaminopimelate ligase [Bacilli bacterium]
MNLKRHFNVDIDICGLTIDSRKVEPGFLFVCVDGLNNDGHQYAKSAEENGAVCILSTRAVDVGVKNIIVKDTMSWFSKLCNEFYNFPTKDMKMIGITGTDGKTTTTSILNQMLDDSGYIGTNGIIYQDKNYMLGHTTTPEADDLFSILLDMRNSGVKYVNLEVTSHAISLKRTQDVEFDILGITNVTSEHLDMHGSLENYIEVKRSMFDYEADVKILNADDIYYEKFKSSLKEYISYGINNKCDYRAKNIVNDLDCLKYILVFQGKEYKVKVNLIGEFNVYNTLLAISICHNMGYSIEESIERLSKVTPIDGRANFINGNQNFTVVIDFAHTPEGVKQITKYFKDIDKNVIVVIGSAGDRDKLKRPVIGKIVSENANYAIFTNEDPRSEDETKLLKDIAAGCINNNHEIITDRETAIKKAFEIARDGDVVLLLGKGIENSIEYSDGEKPYNEEAVARKQLINLGYKLT